jgi:uroporphyrinogen-III synthase
MADGLPQGYGVLVTRPADQAADLVQAIETRGGRAYLFPALEIRPRPTRDIEAEAARLPAADITIFVSRNAVTGGLRYAAGRIAAIGPATAAAIRDAGRQVDIVPAAGFDSEHLLAEPGFADAGDLVVRIVRGQGGREHLARELRARGARVDYLEVYERCLPDVSAAKMRRLESLLSHGEIDAVVVLSMETLNNFSALLSPAARAALAGTPLVSPAARVLKEAGGLFPQCPVHPATGPGAQDIADALAGLADGSANES